MATIKIIKKFQGLGMLRLFDEPWEKLVKLDNGTFSETSTGIIFKTTDGLCVTADKTSIFEDNDQKTSYSGSMNDFGGPNIFIDKLKSKKDFYVLRSFYQDSFLIVLTTDANFQAPPELPFEINEIQFLSDDHIRYQNGQVAITSSSDSQGHNKGANRGIQVEPNINGGEGYIVTIFNMDGNHPLWGDNIQMAPKQMKIISVDNQKIVLRGFGHDSMGGSFADYGLTIYHNGTELTKLKLHMYDRNVDIEYFKSTKEVKKEPEIVELAKHALTQFQNQNPSGARSLLIQIYSSVKSEPEQLNEVKDFKNLGKAFLLMLNQNLSDDIDTLQMIVSVGYLCISKAIDKDKQNFNLFKDRLLLLRIGRNPFKYTVKAALNLNSGGFMTYSMGNSDLKARDAIYKMELADIELNPILYQQVDLFNERRKEFDQMIAREFFLPEKTKQNIIITGMDNHNKLLSYLEKRVLIDGNVDF
jgi:hypothetical protein